MHQAVEDHLTLAADARDLLFRTARTANSFAPDPVPDEQVRAIYDLVKYAPTSMNQQPLRIVLLRSAAARARLISRLAPANRDKSTQAPLIALLAADLNFHERLPEVFPHAPDARAYYADPAVRERSAVFNATLQLGYFILGVRAAGLCAGPIVGYDEDGINRAFFPDGSRRVLAVVNIGRPGPAPWRERLPRLPYEDVVSSA
ncbi:malonic semialdehyde reductase [Streptomyces sp. RS10V-4]|uniref:malonic semialdehyde reductase n=1 Tax=Streptomyces rhizoryzae TaxID=2932493 RepID=UPI00200576E1|nr:malonic semialdehyde reductase [Streptomyces rhizoryzae]MCK7625835.1 malonic semialdehyde reductase [Streptomyces rhizoryzae]